MEYHPIITTLLAYAAGITLGVLVYLFCRTNWSNVAKYALGLSKTVGLRIFEIRKYRIAIYKKYD